MNFDELAQKAVIQQIAASVIEKMTPEHRDEILCRSIGEALKSYSYRGAVEQAVCKEAARIANEMLKEESWQTHIAKNVQDLLTENVKQICEAIPEALLSVFGGTEGTSSYNRGPGLIHAILSRKQKEKT
jgi:hypothetical protein